MYLLITATLLLMPAALTVWLECANPPEVRLVGWHNILIKAIALLAGISTIVALRNYEYAPWPEYPFDHSYRRWTGPYLMVAMIGAGLAFTLAPRFFYLTCNLPKSKRATKIGTVVAYTLGWTLIAVGIKKVLGQ
jgi:hypothetical protein